MEDQKDLMEQRETLVSLDYQVRMVCQETKENQDQEVYQDQVVLKEKMDIKVYQVCRVLQEFLVQKDKGDYLVKWDLKVPKESQDWMVQQDQLGHLDNLGLKEMVVFLVYQALHQMGVQVYLVLQGPQEKRDNLVPLDSQVSLALQVHRDHLELLASLPT